ncbi:MAG: GNAT family N-acetyltransferase [Balneolales bacterium]|nr:GNAT family N-acetyltransferase [Balneolales bacterium]
MLNDAEIIYTKEEGLKYHAKPKKKLSTLIFTSSDAFDFLYDDWKELARRSGRFMYMSPDWAKIWWNHFGENTNRTLYIIAAYNSEKLVAIFPFFKGVSIIAGIEIDHRLQLIGSGGNTNETLGFTDDYGISDFLDFIVDRDFDLPVACLFLTLLRNPGIAKRRIILHQLRDDSFIKEVIYPFLLKNNMVLRIAKSDSCPYIDLSETDTLLSFVEQSKPNARRRFRQTFRAEGANKEYQIQEAKTLGQVKEMSADLIRLHQNRWNEIGFPGVFHDSRFRAFFTEIVQQAHQKKQLWLKQAVDSEGVCAVRMLLLYNNRYYDFLSGYDIESPSAKYRPGIALLLNLIHDAAKSKITSVELLRGREEYKFDFTENQIVNWQITIPAQHKKGFTGKVAVSLLYFSSLLYKHTRREMLLLNVQYRKKGILKMVSGYFKFRMKTLQRG